MPKNTNGTLETFDRSPYVHQNRKLKEEITIRERSDLTDKQKQFMNLALNKQTKVCNVDGFWGTSKTWSSVYCALKLLNDKKIDSIIYVRNPVESSTTGKLGYIPGTGDEKMAPYAAPFYSVLEEMVSKSDIKKLESEGRIKILPLGYARGLTFHCKAVIVDEAASMTLDDLLLILSRMGERSKIFIIGDSLSQSDIGKKSGFAEYCDLFDDEESRENGVYLFEFKEDSDVVRSKLLRFLMKKIKSKICGGIKIAGIS